MENTNNKPKGKILPNFYSPSGFAKLIGKDKSTVSNYIRFGQLIPYYTEDGKPIIHATPELLERFNVEK